MNSELTFIDRLRIVMNGEEYTPWAQRHGISPVTVLGWLNGGSLYPKSWDKLVDATGISKEWWKSGTGDPVMVSSRDKYKTVDALFELAGSELSNERKIGTSEPKSTYSNQSEQAIYIEHYTEAKAAAGQGQITPTDCVVVNVAVNSSDWRNYVGLNPKYVKVISVHGDSMKPTLQHGDQVLIDTACHTFIDDGIYAIQQGDYLRVKRIKLRLDGSIEVKSDNNHEFNSEVYKPDEAAGFVIIGRVLPFKFGKIDL